MPAKRRQNSAETAKGPYYRGMVTQRNKDAFYNNNESDDSDNDDENYESYESYCCSKIIANCCSKIVSPILQELINDFADFIQFYLLKM